MDCIFCEIADKTINSEIVYEDGKIIAFNDLDPKAPTHILIIPKKHISSANDINDDNKEIIAYIFSIIPKLANKFCFDESGYRIVNNCGKDGGQTVDHIHFHLLAGREFKWPPG